MKKTRKPFKPVPMLLVMAAALVVGCGGGGGGGSSSPVLVPSPSTTPQSQSTPQQVLIPSSGGAIAMPAVAGSAPTLSVPAGTSGTAQAQTFTVPARIPALSIGRHTESFSGSLFLLLSLTTTSPITFASSPGISIVLPVGFATANVQFQLAGLAPGATAWQENLELGSYNAATNTVTGAGSFTFPAGTSYLAFYTIPVAASPGPSPSPTTAPTASPASVVVNPTRLSFTATGSAYAQTVLVSQSGYSGTFTRVQIAARLRRLRPGQM